MRLTLAIAVLARSSAFGQYMISAHSGVIQVVDGRAYLNDKAVAPKFGQFPDIKQDQVFRTAEGRAEVLLTPGVFLRMGENSSIRMVSTQPHRYARGSPERRRDGGVRRARQRQRTS